MRSPRDRLAAERFLSATRVAWLTSQLSPSRERALYCQRYNESRDDSTLTHRIDRMPSKWRAELDNELARAKEARLRGNEGRARVCARRAVGIATRLYLDAHGVEVGSSSVLDLLDRLIDQPGVDDNTRRLARLFALRVDTEFKLPAGVDLVAEAVNLCGELLK